MGNKIAKALKKPIRTFNAENRAHRSIGVQKRAPAPKHEADQWDMPEKLKAEIEEKVRTKRTDLHDRLSGIRVVSQGENPTIQKPTEMPFFRVSDVESTYGFAEPINIPKGKISFSQAIEALTKHADNPDAYGAKEINKQFGLKVEDAENMLHYIKPFVVLDMEKKENVKLLYSRASDGDVSVGMDQHPRTYDEDLKFLEQIKKNQGKRTSDGSGIVGREKEGEVAVKSQKIISGSSPQAGTPVDTPQAEPEPVESKSEEPKKKRETKQSTTKKAKAEEPQVTEEVEKVKKTRKTKAKK